MGPLNINPLRNGHWECPMYAEVQKIFKKYKKVDHEKLYHSFDKYLGEFVILMYCYRGKTPKDHFPFFICIFVIHLYPLLKKECFYFPLSMQKD